MVNERSSKEQTLGRRDFLAGAAAVAVAGEAIVAQAEMPPGRFEMTVINPEVVSGGCGLCVIMRTPSGRTYMFDTANGNITGVQLYKDSARKGKISGWFYSLHIGSWGGLFTRILSFLAALLGATLPLTGYYLWVKRLYGKRKSRK